MAHYSKMALRKVFSTSLFILMLLLSHFGAELSRSVVVLVLLNVQVFKQLLAGKVAP